MKKKTPVILLLLVATAAIATFIFRDHIALAAFSRIYDLDIRYDAVRRTRSGQLSIDALRVVDRQRGIGLTAGMALVKLPPLIAIFDTNRRSVAFDFSTVVFIRSEGVPESDDPLLTLVLAPFLNRWTYQSIESSIHMHSGAIVIERCVGTSEDVRLEADGTIDPKNRIDMHMKIAFSEKAQEGLPAEIMGIFADEENSWKSLEVRLTGDRNHPSIRLESKQFKLNLTF